MQPGPGWADWLAFLAARLPPPVRSEESDEAITYVAGDPCEVIVRLSPRAIDVAECVVSGEGATRLLSPRWLGRIRWPRMPEHRAVALVETLVAAARELRRSRFRECAMCGRLTPPESLHDGWTCLACAAQESASSPRDDP